MVIECSEWIADNKFRGGVYLAQIPDPSGSAQVDTSGKAAAAASAVGKVCTVYNGLKNGLRAILGPGSPVTVATFICGALEGVAALYAPPAVPLVAAACPVFFVGLQVVCGASGIISFVDNVIDTVDSEGKVTLHPVATLDATSVTPDGAYFDFPPAGPFGPIPIISFGCPSLDIGVQPSGLLLNVGDQSSISTTVKWAYNGSVYTSSTLNLKWSSMDSSVASVSSTGVVTGVNLGSTSVLVKDTTTGSESATIPVTVTEKFPLTGQWAGTATLVETEGQITTSETIALSASFSATSTSAAESVTGTVVFTEPGDVPALYTITYKMGATTVSMSDVGTPDLSANGSVTITKSGQTISGSGNDGQGDSASGNLTFVTGGLTITGQITSSTDPDFSPGSGSIQISSDGLHLTGTASSSDGTAHVSWTAAKQ